jgi:acetyltransferase-like isoleucine patch superfamily enzyme
MGSAPVNAAPYRVIRGAELGPGVVVRSFARLTECRIGGWTWIGTFVEIRRGAVVGARCKIESHAMLCVGVTLGDDVVVGQGAVFVEHPTARTVVEDGASIGACAIVLPGAHIGARARVGEGAVVTGDVTLGEVSPEVLLGTIVARAPAQALAARA